MNFSIDNLLENKSINDLGAAEKAFVLGQMTAEEYQKQHELIRASQTYFQTANKPLQPRPTTLTTLQNQLASERKKKKGGILIFTHQIPTWSAVAAGLMLFIFFQFSNFMSPKTAVDLPIAQIDTVYLEKEVVKYDTVTLIVNKPIVKTVQIEQKQSINPSYKTNESHVQAPQFYDDRILNSGQINLNNLMTAAQNTSGVTLAKDTLAQVVNRTVF